MTSNPADVQDILERLRSFDYNADIATFYDDHECVSEAADEIERLRAALQQSRSAVEAVAREVFLHAHWDGWIGSQGRRDVQHVDAAKSWNAYVHNSALEKTKERALSQESADERLA